MIRRSTVAMIAYAAVTALVGTLAGVAPAYGGQTCEEKTPTLASVRQGLLLAERVARALDAGGERVVVLARAGQDLTRYSLRYSHAGFAYRSVGGEWRVLHKLNQCGSADSALFRQGLGQFFLDDPWRFEAAWLAPTKEIQDLLWPVLTDNARAATLHSSPYSMVAYVWGAKYQQSNQWLIETLAAAADPGVRTRTQAQAWLQLKGYEPGVLRIGALTRLGGRIGSANIAFDDHPNEKRFADRIETVTVDSVFTWMRATGLAGTVQVVKL